MASFFLAVFFIGVILLPADPFGFVRFLLVLFLAIRAVYHRHMHAHETELDAWRGNPQDQCPSFRNTRLW
jgi:hypothetical protein